MNLTRTGSVLVLATLLARDISGDDSPTLCVNLRNEAAISTQILSAAQAQMRRIYDNAGFEIVWADELASTSGCIVVKVEAHVVIATSSGAVIGLALRQGRVRTAHVFFPRVVDSARQHQLPLSTLLGHVMAHEIGHLLLPADSHSSKGVMRGAWDAAQIRDARTGKLAFTESETRLMTRRLAEHKLFLQLSHQP